MNTTLFLAQIWGPIILAIGIGYIVSRSFYTKLYREIQKESLSVLTFGMAAMAVGIAQVMVHNVWDTFAQGLISFLGWATLIKGTVFTIAPNLVDKAALWEIKRKLIPLAGVVTLIAGAYLTWIGYFV